ncbi:MAG: hypothetical protein KAT65_15980 [Methanophagales archaeon]|nr:hypothetical protein [Methanophagales archaeon]
MKKKLIIVAVGALVVCGLLLSSGALAVKPTDAGNELPSGKHYNLNIIGAKNVGDVGNGNSMGHTLFVKLNNPTKILMTQDPEGVFQVVDRNGLDDGVAEFNIEPGYYDVYARALGKPNGDVTITSWGEFEDDTGNPLLELGSVKLTREKGKPQTVNINKLFYVDVTLLVDGETVTYDKTWVFDIDELLEYYWDYDNDGLKLLQVRFYPRAE